MQNKLFFCQNLAILFISLCLTSCGGTPNRAPVVNLKSHVKYAAQTAPVMISTVRVVPNLNNRLPAHPQNNLAKATPKNIQNNNISKPRIVSSPKPIPKIKPQSPPAPIKQVHWSWPHKGPILRSFQATNSKGIDIGGSTNNSPVRASAKGTVVYSGNGLKGYGNLIIIKHDEDFLSAYAHNDKLMVKEGERVILGQEIAKIGKTDTDKVKLHFEIRYKGKPVDPLQFLPKTP